MPLEAILKIKLAHAHARDAVYSELSTAQLMDDMQSLFDEVILVQSMISSRSQYLKRPDKGRILNESSVEKLHALTNIPKGISIVIADGLSAKAVNKHAYPVLMQLIPLLKNSGYAIMPLCIASQARVAIADHIGALIQANLSIMLIGERPGLTSPESMSAYITYKPSIGITDECRNCISNIRPEGLVYQLAAEKIYYLLQQCFKAKISGTAIKDDQDSSSGNISNG